jgi:hypothetical protein
MWQERCFKGGKTNISNVASETFQTCQERRFKGGKRDILKVARPTGRGIIFDMVAMGVTILEVERETCWMWQ